LRTCGILERSSAVSAENDIHEQIRQRLNQIHDYAPESIGDILQLSLLEVDSAQNLYTFRCRTASWMRNPAGTLHGGMCATILDQAMGLMAYCVKPGEGIAPAISLNLSYHRPLIPGEDVIIRVCVVSVTKSLISVRSEASAASAPDRLCVSGTGTYFYRHIGNGHVKNP